MTSSMLEFDTLHEQHILEHSNDDRKDSNIVVEIANSRIGSPFFLLAFQALTLHLTFKRRLSFLYNWFDAREAVDTAPGYVAICSQLQGWIAGMTDEEIYNEPNASMTLYNGSLTANASCQALWKQFAQRWVYAMTQSHSDKHEKKHVRRFLRGVFYAYTEPEPERFVEAVDAKLRWFFRECLWPLLQSELSKANNQGKDINFILGRICYEVLRDNVEWPFTPPWKDSIYPRASWALHTSAYMLLAYLSNDQVNTLISQGWKPTRFGAIAHICSSAQFQDYWPGHPFRPHNG